MLISHRMKFIYTKTYKTASTSVESYFEPYCMPEGAWCFSHQRDEYVSHTGVIGYRGRDIRGKQWFNHMPASAIRKHVDDSTWDDYFKFCVVRNPFDKLISGFFYFGGDRGARQDVVSRFRRWVRHAPLVDRDKYRIDGQVCLDYFIKYEHLLSGIKYVCASLGIPFEPERIPKLKVGTRNREITAEELYDNATIRVVEKLFEFELNQFDYQFGQFT